MARCSCSSGSLYLRLGLDNSVQSFQWLVLVRSGWAIQSKVERCPFSYRTLCPNLSGMAMNDALHGGQSAAGSRKLILRVKTLEAPEKFSSAPHLHHGLLLFS